MPYDEGLASRVRAALAGRPGISERKMFGGICFLLDGKMCVGVLHDELIVRAGRDHHEDALRRPHARPMDFTGRPMTGMVYVSAAGVTRGAALHRWIDVGVRGAQSSPATKRAKATRARKR